MSFDPDLTGHLIGREQPTVLHAFGPTVELLTEQTDDPTAPGLIRGSLPPGVTIPLHAHAERETFYVLSGRLEVAAVRGADPHWIEIEAGRILHVPPHARHALRGVGDEPAVALIITEPSLVTFFEGFGTPVDDARAGDPPTPEALAHFAGLADARGDWLGSPEDNAALGITIT